MKTINNINNNKGFLVRTWLIAFLIFSAVISLMFLATVNLAEDYGTSGIIKNDFRDKYDTFNETSSEYEGIYKGIGEGSKSGYLSIVFGTDGIFAGMIDTVKVSYQSVGIASGVMKNFITDFGVPEQIAKVIFPLLIMIIIITLIFVVLSSLRGASRL